MLEIEKMSKSLDAVRHARTGIVRMSALKANLKPIPLVASTSCILDRRIRRTEYLDMT